MTRRRFIGLGLVGMTALGTGGCAAGALPAETSHPPIGRFVTVEGLRVHYTDVGSGPPVVLIHGASGNLRDFAFSLTDRLASAGFRAIAFDRPGFGFTERPAERGWDPAVQARILRAAAGEIGAEAPVVVGHSYGGAVAMAWAVDAPDRTRGVVSVAGATHPWGGGAGTVYSLGATDLFGGAVRTLARLLIDPEQPDTIMDRLFRPDAPPEGYGRFIGVGLALRPETFRANAEDLDRLNDLLERQAPRYRGLPVPVEAIHGDADRTVWAEVHSQPLVNEVAQGRLTMLSGVGHMAHHAREDAVMDSVARLAA